MFEHTADLGLRIRAADWNALLAEAGRALFSVIVANLDDVAPRDEVRFRVDETHPEFLLVDWLGELLYTFDAKRLVLSTFDVRADPAGLSAIATGERFDPNRHVAAHEVKAITYHGLKVERDNGGWLAELILDI